MIQINRFFFYYKEYLIFLIAVFFSLLLIFSSQSRQVDVLRRSIAVFSDTVQTRLMWITLIFNALDENSRLRHDNLRFSLANAQLHRAYLENLHLRKLLGFKERAQYVYLPAKVIARAVYPYTNTIKIDVGTEDGIRKNIPVLTDRGLVGKIIETTQSSVVVQILTDVNCSISAKIRNERITGILVWNTGNDWLLKNVAKSFKVQAGDTILTSGYSEIYPPDIPIGAVTDFSDEEPGLFKNIHVSTFVDFDRLEEVFIILNFSSAEAAQQTSQLEQGQ